MIVDAGGIRGAYQCINCYWMVFKQIFANCMLFGTVYIQDKAAYKRP